MKPKLLLRLSSGTMIFHLVGHTLGHAGWKHPAEPVQQEVVRQMQENRFLFMGSIRSLGEYYDGYGYACSVALAFFALILWLSSDAANENKVLTTKMVGGTTVCLFAWSVNEFIFFFPFAALITALAGTLALVALIQVRSS